MKTKMVLAILATLIFLGVAPGVIAQPGEPRIKIESATIDGNRKKVVVIVKNAPLPTDVKDWILLIPGKGYVSKLETAISQGQLTITGDLPDWQRVVLETGHKVSLSYKNSEVGALVADIELPPIAAGAEPYLSSLKPLGGREGSEIAITGINLGKDITESVVCLYEKTIIKDETNPPKAVPVLVQPVTVNSPQQDESKSQTLKFLIPEGQNLAGRWLFPKTIQVKVAVNGHLSVKSVDLKVVARGFYNWLIAPALILLAVLAWAIFLIVRGKNIKTLFLDKKTNTYSLSKCQAIAWTAVLIGSYFYLAIGRSIVIEKGIIPDFNASLLPLLGISYGGLLIAHSIGTFIPKNDLKTTPPSLMDLISEGGEISVNRLQLVCFNITTIVIFLYNLSGPNLLIKGLPDIPDTLLGLLGVSQGGYLLGKVTGGRTTINYVRPRYVKVNAEKTKLALIGTGFVQSTKLLIQDVPELKEAAFESDTRLSIELPKLTLEGPKQIVLVPPTGSSIVIDNAFKVVNVSLEKIERLAANRKQAKISVKGLEVQESINVTIEGKSTIVKEKDPMAGTITVEAQTDIADQAVFTLSTEDGAITVEGKLAA